jgi:rhodanese-related sulfurtransferase
MRRHVMVFSPSKSACFIQFALLLQTVLLTMLVSTTVAWAKPEILKAETAHQAALKGDIILVDIRTLEEWADTGIGDGAIALDMTAKTFIKSLIALRTAQPNKQIAFICATGGRSGYLTRYLWKNGFQNTADVTEGMLGSRAGPGWLKAGLPIYSGEPSEIEIRLAPFMP